MKQLILICLLMFSTLAVAEQVQVGNKIYLYLPGEVEFDEPFEVAKDGTITLPELGKIKVTGAELAEIEQQLRAALSEVYVAMDDFYVEIRSRDIFINVMGYVNDPSQVSIPRDGNIQMVIARAGGLKPGAQLDRLQIRRGNDVIEFNYKAYLDSGNIDLLPQLQSADTVFVPVSPLLGNVQIDFDAQTLSASGDASDNSAITLLGEVHNPGSFSFKENMSVLDALMRAEGVTRYADVTKIRVIVDKTPVVFDLKAYLDKPNNDTMPALKAGSTIYVPIMVDDVNTTSRTVYIMGEVQKPGAYEAGDSTSFLDILANAGGPTRFAETRQIKILTPSGESILFDLQGYSEGIVTVKVPNLNPGDVIFVPEKTDQNEKSWLKVPPKRAIKIIGAIQSPGRYEWSPEMDFTDLLAHAGGPTKGANINDIKIVRNGEVTKRFDLEQYTINDAGNYELPNLIAGDTIIVEELPVDPADNKSQWIRQESSKSIYIMGQVGSPGRYAFNTNMHFIDILAAADGPTDNADLRNIRITHRNGNTAKVSKLNLALYFETGDETLFPHVLPGDTIYIPEKDKDWLRTPKEQVVRIMGAVEKPGRYSFDDTMTVLDVLAEAGGPSSSALIDKIVVVNHSCCKEQSRVFDLEEFVKNPNSAYIPVLRAGDTLYVPDKGQDLISQFKSNFLDFITVIALVVGL
ncbi:SLBB domain-containing protein [Pseudoalteromonas sp. BZK2]|uniref:SLBB domain-containing protein n=1 Tax=Pseudoalteromonas lipolytica TaxID=570156 RepID=A0A0P7EBI3_9GAMM|nr:MULTISPECIES: SLBB domain-containing protein [Pseudoalteromonas]KPM82633.1 sugar ABC transporter substrate-binding protein [Pseudoalteromonas lipolytica]MBC7007588.1 SLBB domain-containing protein [Pseudoalteromonas sp. BZK2]MCF2914836.1 SLBB domain-containing protein [Pseudoalteromonas sp. Cn5-37]NHH89437.1 Polysialic acid transport protein KpsD [Pseudoalteromonas sp. MB47]TMP19135.1 sugar ABC transporter substrate-binding protein [Pseudoalteromonas sp. S2721]